MCIYLRVESAQVVGGILSMDFKSIMSIVAEVTALIGIFVAPWLAVKLSLKQFHSTRWWEKQQEAYSNIMAQLTALHYVLGRWCDEGSHLIALSKFRKGHPEEGIQRSQRNHRESGCCWGVPDFNRCSECIDEVDKGTQQG